MPDREHRILHRLDHVVDRQGVLDISARGIDPQLHLAGRAVEEQQRAGHLLCDVEAVLFPDDCLEENPPRPHVQPELDQIPSQILIFTHARNLPFTMTMIWRFPFGPIRQCAASQLDGPLV